MPRVKNNLQQLCLLTVTILSLSSCFDSNSKTNPHGLNKYNKSSFSYMGFVERSIQLKFKIQQDSISTITAIVQTDYDYKYPVNFQWRLGEYVFAQNADDLTGQIPLLRKNEPVYIKLQVQGFGVKSINRYVRFEAFGTHPSHRIFADGVVSSQKNNSFESIVQEVELYKKQKDDK